MIEPCAEFIESIIWDKNPIPCVRLLNHAGKHQAFKPNEGSSPVTYMDIRWDEDDGDMAYMDSPVLWNECDTCGILIRDEPVRCDDCLLEDRIHDIVSKYQNELIVVNGTLILEKEKISKNMTIQRTVLWLDKTKPPLVSSYLHNVSGPLPKKYRVALPDNAKIKETKTSGFNLVA
jgi:hypothetical protein